MEKPRNIVLVLGNGFDLDLGRKTSYKDFWESEFCPKDYPAPLIRHLNQRWKDGGDAVKWYDLENELLEYFEATTSPGYEDFVTDKEREFLLAWKQGNSSHINGYSRYETEIESLIMKGIVELDRSWGYYMSCRFRDELVLDNVSRDKKALELIKRGLCSYLKSVEQTKENTGSVALATIYALSETIEAGNELVIYSFNYTTLPYPYCDYDNLHYVHGRCKDENIIIGTKDDECFNADYDFLQKSFDPNFKTPKIVYDLLYADEIVFFGHSLGMNDSQYFKPFFSQQTNIENPKRKNITIFTRNEKSVMEIKRSLQKMTGYNFSLLNSLNDLEIIMTENISTHYKSYKSFLSRFLDDSQKLRSALRGLDG